MDKPILRWKPHPTIPFGDSLVSSAGDFSLLVTRGFHPPGMPEPMWGGMGGPFHLKSEYPTRQEAMIAAEQKLKDECVKALAAMGAATKHEQAEAEIKRLREAVDRFQDACERHGIDVDEDGYEII